MTDEQLIATLVAFGNERYPKIERRAITEDEQGISIKKFIESLTYSTVEVDKVS